MSFQEGAERRELPGEKMSDIKKVGLAIAGLYWISAALISMVGFGPRETRYDRERNLLLASIGISVFVLALP